MPDLEEDKRSRVGASEGKRRRSEEGRELL